MFSLHPFLLKLSPELRTSWENLLLKLLLLFLKAITFIYLWGNRVVACAMASVCRPKTTCGTWSSPPTLRVLGLNSGRQAWR